MKAVIMAGGRGTRLWPISRQSKPKQFQCLTSDKTMLQETFARLRMKYAPKDIYVSTNMEYTEEVARELPEIPKKNIISEPEARGTASSFALSIAHIAADNPKEIVAFFPADHLVKQPAPLMEGLVHAKRYIEKHPDAIVTFGIVPDYPETGYGYIRRSTQHNHIGEDTIYTVERFVEKPDVETARRYMEDGNYYWNTGMYMFRADTMAEKFNRFLPDTHKRMQRIRDAIETDTYDAVLKEEYPLMDKINFEYAIVENDTHVVVMPLSIGWSDVGSWASLKDALTSNAKDHFVRGEHVDFGSENLLVYGSDKLIATVGVKDLIIVDTEDAILICDRSKSQMISDVVKQLEKSKNIKQL